MSEGKTGNWRFAISRRWFGYLGMAIVFAIACVLLSNWQFDRRAEAQQEIDRITTNYDKTPQQLTSALPSLTAFDDNAKWSPITMTGTYLSDDQLLVRNRPYGGKPGFEILTPLLLPDATVFIVDRGWVPSGNKQDSPDSIPVAPTGTVTVVARIQGGEPVLPGRTAPAGQIPTINLPQIATQLEKPTYTGAYGLLASESPAVAVMPAPAIEPELDEGPHLSYAIQWILFALFGFGGLAYALRQEFRIRNADDPDEMVRAEKRRVKDTKRARTDAEIEDALIDG